MQLVPVAQVFYMVGGYMEDFVNKFLSKFERWAGMGTSLDNEMYTNFMQQQSLLGEINKACQKY